MWSPGPAEDDFQPGRRCDAVQCTGGLGGGGVVNWEYSLAAILGLPALLKPHPPALG